MASHWHGAVARPASVPGRVDVDFGSETGLDFHGAKRALAPAIRAAQHPGTGLSTPDGRIVTPAQWWLEHEPLTWLTVPVVGVMFAVVECGGHCGDAAMAFADEVVRILRAAGLDVGRESVVPNMMPPD